MTDAATPNNLEALAQAHENEAFALLVETVRDKDQKMEHRLKAAERILDQARGKPKVALPKDPAQQKRKAVTMSLETLMRIAQGAMTRVANKDAIDAEFTPAPRKRPMNPYATQTAQPQLAASPQLPAPIVPGTKPDTATPATSDIDDLLS